MSTEFTGGSVDYYKVDVKDPTSKGEPYIAECNDIIEALGMNYAEGNAFKAIWRNCAARTLDKRKRGDEALYNAEKVVIFGGRMIRQALYNAIRESAEQPGVAAPVTRSQDSIHADALFMVSQARNAGNHSASMRRVLAIEYAGTDFAVRDYILENFGELDFQVEADLARAKSAEHVQD